MSIPQSKYVVINSAIANTAGASYKELIARVFTTNPLFAVNSVYEFTSSKDVSDFAGSASAEARFAQEYFGWVSKRATKPTKISFMRYSLEALAPSIYATKSVPLATLTAVTNGSMVVNMGGTAYTISGVDLSSATTYAEVATVLQTAIRANTSGGALWTGATVVYNASTNFQLTGGATGANEINFAEPAGAGTDLSVLIGWSSGNAPVLSNGTAAATVTDILNKSIELSTNFLTFGFLTPSDAYNNLAEIGAFVQEQNMNYRFCFDLGASNYSDGMEIASSFEGMTATYNVNYGNTSINPAWIMNAILPATTNYNVVNGVKNYMFQEFPSQAVAVGNDDGTLYQTLDNLCVNYNGQTQKSGQKITFYQNGFNADGTDSAVFDNEAWLKDHIATDLINIFLGLDFVSADKDGIAIIKTVLETNATLALTNHVISAGQTFDNTQKAYITQLTGDENAWQTVQNNGYMFDVNIATETQGTGVIHVGEYVLIYAKNNVVRKIEGTHILI